MDKRAATSGTRGTTDYLRGLAIAGVLVSHYRIHFCDGVQEFEGYGNAIVALFLILSGYGNLLSMRKLLGNWERPGIGPFLTFFRHRAVRIYPEYLLALLLTIWIFGQRFTLINYLGLESAYWFIHSIIQCYLASPLLYYAFVRLGPRRSFWTVSLVFALINLPQAVLDPAAHPTLFSNVFVYRGMFFANIYLFFLGMLLPGAAAALKDKTPKIPGLLVLLAYLAAVLLNGVTAYGHAVPNTLLFLAANFGVCLILLAAPTSLPGGPLLRLLGRGSYQIYLFEPFYFYVLFRSGTVIKGTEGLLSYLLFFPAFLLACLAVDRLLTLLLRR